MRQIALSLILLSNLVCCGCLTIRCSDDVKANSSSPDDKYIATLYERNCGATTDFTTIVNLRSSKEKFDSEKGDIVIIEGRRQVNILWKDERTLQVECKDCRSEDMFKRESVWGDIEILYEARAN
jgi:hypothetical protein